MNQKLSIGIKSAAIVAIVAGVATAGFEIKESKATLTAPSGKCALNLTTNLSGMNTKVGTWTSSQTIQSIGTIDFDAGMVYFVDTNVSNFGGANAATTKKAGEVAFTLSPSSTAAGMYLVTFSGGSKANLMSTNSGNTMFIAGVPTADDDGPQATGVCQAL